MDYNVHSRFRKSLLALSFIVLGSLSYAVNHDQSLLLRKNQDTAVPDKSTQTKAAKIQLLNEIVF